MKCLPFPRAVAALLTLAFATSAVADHHEEAAPEPGSTAAVLHHHLTSFGAGDVEAILSDYAEGAVIIGPGGAMTGDAIRGLFEGLTAEFGQEGVTFEMGTTFVEGELAYITWSADTPDNAYEFVTDTFVIRDGKITGQTFGGVIQPKSKE